MRVFCGTTVLWIIADSYGACQRHEVHSLQIVANPMKPLILIGALGLAGCATAPLPPEIAAITLVPVSSAAIDVHRPKFQMSDGWLELQGCVFRKSRAETTADSHIDLVFLDPAGGKLGVETTNFHPRSVPQTGTTTRGAPAQPHACFRVTIIQLPAGTRAIEVRGHDGPHR